jgi:hypothetical protein
MLYTWYIPTIYLVGVPDGDRYILEEKLEFERYIMILKGKGTYRDSMEKVP